MALSVQEQFETLAGEALSAQLLLVALCKHLRNIDSLHADAVAAAFDDAASQAESFAIQFGKTASPHHVVKAGRIIEDLRTAAFRDED